MGYALFATRKIVLTNQLFVLQMQLDNIMQQKQSLLDFSANIADSVVTVDEIAGDASNFTNYQEYLAGAQAYASSGDTAEVIGEIGAMATSQNDSEAYLAAVAEMLNQSVNQKFTDAYNKKLAAAENQLDLQQKRIETKIAATTKQLEAVEEAEGAAIDRATPKFNGVG